MGEVDYVAAEGLVPLIEKMGDNVVGCEIGVAAGNSTCHILGNCRNVICMYAIDPYKAYKDIHGEITWDMVEADYKLAKQKLEYYGGRVIFIRKASEQAYNFIPDNILDFIFIDGNHSLSYVHYDVCSYYRKVKKGGLISGHDWSCQSVRDALGIFREGEKITTEIQFAENNVWYWYK